MAAKPLTAAEKKWLKELQAVLDKCPSKRMGFYTSGGSPTVHVFDLPVADAWEAANVSQYDRMHGYGSYSLGLEAAGADLGVVDFPATISCVG